MKISEGYLVISERRGGEEIVSTFRHACKSELSKRWVSAVTILQTKHSLGPAKQMKQRKTHNKGLGN